MQGVVGAEGQIPSATRLYGIGVHTPIGMLTTRSDLLNFIIFSL